MNEIPSDLIKQLTQLSDLNSFFKFVVFHFRWFEIYAITAISIAFVAMVVVFLTRKKETFKKYHRAMSNSIDVVFASVITQVVVLFIASYHLNYMPLNNGQINLLKSIDNPKFQELLEPYVWEHSSNINAVTIAVKDYKKKKSRYNEFKKFHLLTGE